MGSYMQPPPHLFHLCPGSQEGWGGIPPEMSFSLISPCHPTLLVRTLVQREGTAVQGIPCPKTCLQSLSAWQCTANSLELEGSGSTTKVSPGGPLV